MIKRKRNIYLSRLKLVTVDKFVLFFFLIINIGFYYSQYLSLINAAYILLCLGFARKLILYRKFIHKKYLVITILFAVYSFFSTLWAKDPELSSQNTAILLKYVLISIMLINLLDKRENVRFTLWILAVSGLLYTLFFLSYWDVSALGFNRANTALAGVEIELPNLNIVGLVAANSFVCLFFFYFYERKKIALALAAIAFVTIFFLGSRQSIIFIFIGIGMIFLRLKGSSKFGVVILFATFFELLIFLIPEDYFSFIWDRFRELKIFSKLSNMDYGDQLRVDFITRSTAYINDKPFFGHGYFNFARLFYRDQGIAVYSHNNFIEIIVGLGIAGLIIYYSLYYVIVRQIVWTKKMDYSYLFATLLVLNLFNQFFIVVSNDRFTWILLPTIYAGTKLFRPDIEKINHEN